MSDHTKIEWADATVNAVNGCSVLSPGCTNCYAMRLAGTRLQHHPSRAGLTQPSKAGPVWTGEVRLHEPALLQPLRWKAPRRIFWNAHGDLFHEAVPDEWIDRVFAVCALTPQHTHMILTKRSARMWEFFGAPILRQQMRGDFVRQINRDGHNPRKGCTPDAMFAPYPLANVWLGVSVEDQARADERVPDLLATPAAVRFISAEPLLGPVRLDRLWQRPGASGGWHDALTGREHHGPAVIGGGTKLDWVIAGGESGPGARPMHPEWARSLRDQCAAAGVAFHFKQWGAFRPLTDAEEKQACGATRVNCDVHGPAFMLPAAKKVAGRELDGVEHNAFPLPARSLPA